MNVAYFRRRLLLSLKLLRPRLVDPLRIRKLSWCWFTVRLSQGSLRWPSVNHANVRECTQQLRAFRPNRICLCIGGVLGYKTAVVLARLVSLSMVDCYTMNVECFRLRFLLSWSLLRSGGIGNAIDSDRIDLLLSLDKASVTFVIGCITGYCEIRSQ